MAQLVEQLIRNQQAAGSSPASSSKLAFGMLPEASFFIPASFLSRREVLETKKLYGHYKTVQLFDFYVRRNLHQHISAI